MAEKEPTGYIDACINQERLNAVTEWHNQEWSKIETARFMAEEGY